MMTEPCCKVCRAVSRSSDRLGVLNVGLPSFARACRFSFFFFFSVLATWNFADIINTFNAFETNTSEGTLRTFLKVFKVTPLLIAMQCNESGQPAQHQCGRLLSR